VKHGSDAKAYKILDSLRGTLRPRPFPVVSGIDEPILRLEEAYGTGKGAQIVREIEATGQIVFHCVGDTGNVKGPKDEDLVADKMVSDFNEAQTTAIPSFFYHLGDVVSIALVRRLIITISSTIPTGITLLRSLPSRVIMMVW
jgi:hypothetical protein